MDWGNKVLEDFATQAWTWRNVKRGYIRFHTSLPKSSLGNPSNRLPEEAKMLRTIQSLHSILAAERCGMQTLEELQGLFLVLRIRDCLREVVPVAQHNSASYDIYNLQSTTARDSA